MSQKAKKNPKYIALPTHVVLPLELGDEAGLEEVPGLPDGPDADDGQPGGTVDQLGADAVQHGGQVCGELDTL